MEHKKNNDDAVLAVMEDIINTFDEYVVCFSFATKGIAKQGEELAKHSYEKGHRIWIGSDVATNPKMYARIDTVECIEKCKKDGYFSNELAKSLLSIMYSLWDEVYRHRLAKVTGLDAQYIECPLMGDLRKIRHCIIHNKSIVPDNGIRFEALEWLLPPREELVVTYKMFLELNDGIRGDKMRIQGWRIPPLLQELMPQMSEKERKDFHAFFKKPENRKNNVEWPGLGKFLGRIKYYQSKNDSSPKA
ncbi:MULTISPECIES: hypothetical protein [Klebsiella pneumoniae complex]|uniref:hypothetical protein n=1 Tax=Klebsiella pneumoniae complex TaxID=3390273 RepID=UPI000C7E27FD|nr:MULTISPECIES: hypothetical protein [Klebsiella]HBS5604805.1 hypothetical protein [Klebsiella quasipneumoniae subsp. quasipneumoniae]EMB9114840.1 hypothetical protein [Klebsiella quasipneumoniae]EME4046435.1 hypothetical protein [Klebsiella quasipneumoniae]MBQ5143564.1 hypothetical protein [Klebsiella pneumoniae]MCH9491698.1 hypothetical protein [Klebsiella pneumoniae]